MTSSDAHRDPWERQPREPARAFAYFTQYLRLGPGRTVRRLAQIVDKTATNLHRIARDWDWDRRASAWDAAEDTEYRHQAVAARIQARKDIDAVASTMLSICGAQLALLARKATAATAAGKPLDISPNELTRMVEVAAKLRLSVAGDVTDRVQITGPTTPSDEHPEMTQEEVRARIHELVERVRTFLPEAGPDTSD